MHSIEFNLGSALVLAVFLFLGAPVEGVSEPNVPPQNPLQTEIYFSPTQPTDNERVSMVMPHALNVCGWTEPELVDIEVFSSQIRVEIAASAIFSGGLEPALAPASTPAPTPGARSEAASKCTPAVPYLYAQAIDLGRLDPGTYRVLLFLTQADSEPRLTAFTTEADLVVTDAPDEVALQGDRFFAAVDWTDFAGVTGAGRPVPDPSPDSTLFTFFDDSNWELMVKVLDGCAINGHYWVFTAAATDAAYDVVVTDSATGAAWTDSNPLGVRAPAVADTAAFPCP